MKFDEYQQTIEKFAVYPREAQLTAIAYLTLGLNGEAGEVAEQVKKAIRNDGQINDERRARILDEMGDVLWYISRLASEFGATLSDVAEQNIGKLEERRNQKNLKHE
jgi:NTP pyrophosphatase (non-canonical NTP hydrolase)